MEKIFTGKTAEEAVEAGLKELGLARDAVTVEILEQGKKGLFGLGAVPAKVKLTVAEAQKAQEVQAVQEKPVPSPAPEGETDGMRAVAFLEELLPLLGENVTPVLQSEDEKIVIQLQADGAKAIIGRRGEVIDAIQVLAGAVANTGRREYKRVVVDCGNYREEREETLKHVAQKMAAKAVRLGKKVRLEPMNPYERRIIHATLADSMDVYTKSEGREPARFVVIYPKNAKSRPPKDGKRGGDNRGRDRKNGQKKPAYGSERAKTYQHRDLPSEATPESSGTSFNSGSTPGYKKGGFSGFFGTYLGNANDDDTPDTPVKPDTPDTDE